MLAGEETSMNPLGMVEAIMGAMKHAAALDLERGGNKDDHEKVVVFTDQLRKAMHNTFRYGQGTRDLSGPSGFTTEEFIKKVAWRLDRYLVAEEEDSDVPTLSEPNRAFRRNHKIDEKAVKAMFDTYDVDGNGSIEFEEFTDMLVKLGVAPQKA